MVGMADKHGVFKSERLRMSGTESWRKLIAENTKKQIEDGIGANKGEVRE